MSEGKDKKGKKCYEYLVHFQGWSNSWDRTVSEDFLLKDNAANRRLQRELAEKSQLQLGAYLVNKNSVNCALSEESFNFPVSSRKEEKKEA